VPIFEDRPLAQGTLKAILVNAGLTEDEFRELLSVEPVAADDENERAASPSPRYVVLDYVVEVPDGAEVDGLIDRIVDALTLAVEAEGALIGGGARPLEEAEILARYDALEVAEAALDTGPGSGED
jgi:hypothetical protein